MVRLCLIFLTALVTTLSFPISLTAKTNILTWDFSPGDKDYKFIFNKPNEPYLFTLRERCRLDSLVINADSDLDKVILVCKWVNGLWEHSSKNPPEKNDPLMILAKVKSGMRFSCLEYSSVTAGCLNSLGIPARVVDLLPVDVKHAKMGSVHVVVEAFIKERQKWVMVDTQWNVVPLLKGFPLNAVELYTMIFKNASGLGFGNLPDSLKQDYKDFIMPYLYYYQVLVDQRIFGTEIPKRKHGSLVLIPMNGSEPQNMEGQRSYNKVFTRKIAEFYRKPPIDTNY